MGSSNPYNPPQQPSSAIASLPPRPADDELPPHAIVIEGCISKPDAREAFWLTIRPRSAFRLLGIGLLMVALLVSVAQIVTAPQEFAGYILTLIVLLLSAYPVLVPRHQAWRSFKNPRGIGAPHRRIISPAGIESITAESQTVVRWTAFSKYQRSERVAIVFFASSPKICYVIPRSLFASDTDWQRFVELLETNLPSG